LILPDDALQRHGGQSAAEHGTEQQNALASPEQPVLPDDRPQGAPAASDGSFESNVSHKCLLMTNAKDHGDEQHEALLRTGLIAQLRPQERLLSDAGRKGGRRAQEDQAGLLQARAEVPSGQGRRRPLNS